MTPCLTFAADRLRVFIVVALLLVEGDDDAIPADNGFQDDTTGRRLDLQVSSHGLCGQTHKRRQRAEVQPHNGGAYASRPTDERRRRAIADSHGVQRPNEPGTEDPERLGITEVTGANIAQLAIAWVLAKAKNIVPLVGARRRDRLDESLCALVVELGPSDVEQIERTVPPGAAASRARNRGYLSRVSVVICARRDRGRRLVPRHPATPSCPPRRRAASRGRCWRADQPAGIL